MPSCQDCVELKYQAATSSLQLARLSKTIAVFGYMPDCIIADTEPHDAGQLRTLSHGSVEIIVASVASLTSALVNHKLTDIVKVLQELNTEDAIKKLAAHAPMYKLSVSAHCSYWIPAASVVMVRVNGSSHVVGVRRAIFPITCGSALTAILALRQNEGNSEATAVVQLFLRQLRDMQAATAAASALPAILADA